MLDGRNGAPDTISRRVRDAYRHDARRWICVSTGLTTLLCKISLQFCCEFIDNNRSNIILTRNIARFLKLPTSILYIAHSAFTLQSLIENYKDPKKRQLAKIIGKSANLANSIIEVLMLLKVIHFFAGYNSNVVGHFGLASTVLFLFISEPISYYYTWKKYLDNKDPNKSFECRKDLMISTLTFSLGLLNFILKRVEITTIPMDLGNGVIYNFNLSITIGIMYSAVFLILNVEKLFNQPINGTDPPSRVDHTHADDHVYNSPFIG